MRTPASAVSQATFSLSSMYFTIARNSRTSPRQTKVWSRPELGPISLTGSASSGLSARKTICRLGWISLAARQNSVMSIVPMRDLVMTRSSCRTFRMARASSADATVVMRGAQLNLSS